MGMPFRSEKMAFCQLILQNEASFNCMAELGELGLLQFKDLNKKKSIFKRKYINEVKRCEKLERILKFLKHELEKNGIEIPEESATYPAANHRVLSEYEGRLEGLEKEVRGIDDRLEQLSISFVGLIQLKHLLRKTDSFFEEVDRRYDKTPVLDPVTHIEVSTTSTPPPHHSSSETLIPLDIISEDVGSTSKAVTAATHYVNTFKLKFLAGVILREKLEYFERMLFRVCHGNTLLKYADVDVVMPASLVGSLEQDSNIHKAVFLIFFQGDQLRAKVTKICEGFHAKIYPCPDSQLERRTMAMGVMTRLEDLNMVLNQTQDYFHSVLHSLSRQIAPWSVSIMKTKQIYHQLNKLHFDKNLKTLFGKCWAPVRDLDKIHVALLSGASNSQSNESSVIFHQIPTQDSPPTYHKTNAITEVYQDIINAYSIPAYLEVNPAVFSIITFPFLFSVMFGDIGHGFILALFGLFTIFFNFSDKIKKNEIFHMIYSGRYIIFLMGLFSMYSGFIYNDCFSLPLNLFGSNWSPRNISDKLLHSEEYIGLDPLRKDQFNGHIYTFGMDPVWQLAKNKISWLNSFKMKISVIFGVSHMFFGILISFTNHRFFNHKLAIYAEFIPQVIFILSTFGYLVVLVIYKWLAYDATQSTVAPSLLIGFINMFLVSYPPQPPSVVVSDFRYVLQVGLLLSALVCVPWMLFLKPCILKRREDSKKNYGYNRTRSNRHNSYEENASLLTRDGADDDEDDDILVDDDTALANSTEYDFNSSDSDEDDDDVILDRSKFQNNYSSTRNRNNNNGNNININSSNNNNNENISSAINVGRASSVFTLLADGRQEVTNEVGGKRVKNKPQKEEFSFGEVMVTQAIHTIEYCLGCVSHTASYLRLWALSLAHAQLSEVLWKMVLHYGLTWAGNSYWGSVLLFLLFTPWALATVVVLLVMEGLSAFLHTLRLHWIEFMSKFFKGEGHPFKPYSFHSLGLEFIDKDQHS